MNIKDLGYFIFMSEQEQKNICVKCINKNTCNNYDINKKSCPAFKNRSAKK